jgi:hypothetical protein
MVIFRLKNVFEYTAYNHKIGKYSRSVTYENFNSLTPPWLVQPEVFIRF